MSRTELRRTATLAALLALLVVTVLLRSVGWGVATAGPHLAFPGADPYYHARRVTLILNGEEAAYGLDPYLLYPDGDLVPWPPGFDLLLAGVVWLSGAEEGRARDLALAATMPVLGALAVLLLFLLARRLALDGAAPLAAAGLLAVLPGHARVTLFGRVDHHGLVPVVVLALLLSLVAAGQARASVRRAGWTAAAGALAGYSFLSWPSSPWIYLGLILAAAILARALRLRRRALGGEPSAEAPELLPLGALAVALGVAPLMVLLTLLAFPPVDPFHPSGLSLWTLFGALGLAFTGAAAALISRRVRDRPGRWWLVVLGTAGLGLLAHVPLLWIVARSVGLAETASLLTARDPLLRALGESAPLLAEPVIALGQYSGLLFLAPVVLLWPLLDRRVLAGRADLRLLVGVWLCPLALLTLLQIRFGEIFVPFYALGLAVLLVAIGRRIGRQPPARRWGLGLGGALLLVLAAWPSAFTYVLWCRGGTGPATSINQICAYRGPSPHQTGEGRPEHGAFVRWSLGHLVLYRCGDSPVANPFGSDRGRKAIARFARLGLARDAELDRELPAGGLRYWFAQPLAPAVATYAALAGLPAEDFVAPGPDEELEARLTERYYESVVSRLAHFDGSRTRYRGRIYNGLGNFRLILESGRPLSVVPGYGRLVKLYEWVDGALLGGSGRPGSEVLVGTEIVVAGGRHFRYMRQVTANLDGSFEVRVPYPTEPGLDGAYAVEPYRVVVDGVIYHVRVPRAAIRDGRRIEVAPPAAPAAAQEP